MMLLESRFTCSLAAGMLMLLHLVCIAGAHLHLPKETAGLTDRTDRTSCRNDEGFRDPGTVAKRGILASVTRSIIRPIKSFTCGVEASCILARA